MSSKRKKSSSSTKQGKKPKAPMESVQEKEEKEKETRKVKAQEEETTIERKKEEDRKQKAENLQRKKEEDRKQKTENLKREEEEKEKLKTKELKFKQNQEKNKTIALAVDKESDEYHERLRAESKNENIFFVFESEEHPNTQIVCRGKSREKALESMDSLLEGTQVSDASPACKSLAVALNSIASRTESEGTVHEICFVQPECMGSERFTMTVSGESSWAPDQLSGCEGGVGTFANRNLRFWVGGVDVEQMEWGDGFGYDNGGIGKVLLTTARFFTARNPPRLKYEEMEYETLTAVELALPTEVGGIQTCSYVELDFPMEGRGYLPGEIILIQDLRKIRFYTDPRSVEIVMPEERTRTTKEWGNYFRASYHGKPKEKLSRKQLIGLEDYMKTGAVPKRFLHPWDLKLYGCLESLLDQEVDVPECGSAASDFDAKLKKAVCYEWVLDEIRLSSTKRAKGTEEDPNDDSDGDKDRDNNDKEE